MTSSSFRNPLAMYSLLQLEVSWRASTLPVNDVPVVLPEVEIAPISAEVYQAPSGSLPGGLTGIGACGFRLWLGSTTGGTSGRSSANAGETNVAASASAKSE